MGEAADAEHGDKIAGLRRRVSQGAERREPRAQKWRRIDRRQIVRYRHEPVRLCDHHFGISAVMMNAGIFLVLAVHEIAIPAELAMAARAAEKPDTHALADRPTLDADTKRIDPADDLMAWNARPLDRKQAFHHAGIRVADAPGLHADAHFPRSRRLQGLLCNLQPAWANRLHGTIRRCGFHHSPLKRVHYDSQRCRYPCAVV